MLEDFGQHLGGDRDRDIRHRLDQDVAHGALVLAVEIGVHEADRDGGDAASFQNARDLARRGDVERFEHDAGGIDAFGHRQPVAPRHVRLDDVLVGVPEVFLVGAPDLDDVAKALGGHHGGARQPARDQGIGRDRGAVREQRDLGEVDSGLGHPAHDAVDGVGRRRRLLDADQAGGLIHDTDVGEGAADVNGHANVLHDATSFHTRARHLRRRGGCQIPEVSTGIMRRWELTRLTLSAGSFAPGSTGASIPGRVPKIRRPACRRRPRR